MKRMALLATLLLISSCNAELTVNVGGAVQGIVVQAGNITITLPGVTISLQGRTVVTNSSGEFFLGDLETGDYVMTVRKPGYQQRKVEVRVRRDEFTNLQIELART
jgi:uncharacterized membrane protein